jgi:tRNA A-37 threonylcarbamoyl transferase component Bud32
MSKPPVLIKAPQKRAQHGMSAVFLESAATWHASGEHVYVKRQDDYWCRPPWRLFRRTPTLRRELRGLSACRRLGVPVPEVVHYHEAGLKAELVLMEVRDALPLDEALTAPAADRPAIVDRVACTVARLHRGGWSHGALYPSHVLVGTAPDYPVTLIDLEKARHTRLRRRNDLERFWRHTAMLTAEERIAFERRYLEVLHGG